VSLCCERRVRVSFAVKQAGLSDGVRLELFDHLRRQRDEQGLTCLLLTRDMRLGSALAEEVVVLFTGQIVETGAAASLSRQPSKSRHCSRFLEA